uniref:Uncharacterized protein n=1 Tax=Arundo donax TaxID=35708 RepID=A0A0A9CR16_ARUDO
MLPPVSGAATHRTCLLIGAPYRPSPDLAVNPHRDNQIGSFGVVHMRWHSSRETLVISVTPDAEAAMPMAVASGLFSGRIARK